MKIKYLQVRIAWERNLLSIWPCMITRLGGTVEKVLVSYFVHLATAIMLHLWLGKNWQTGSFAESVKFLNVSDAALIKQGVLQSSVICQLVLRRWICSLEDGRNVTYHLSVWVWILPSLCSAQIMNINIWGAGKGGVPPLTKGKYVFAVIFNFACSYLLWLFVSHHWGDITVHVSSLINPHPLIKVS